VTFLGVAVPPISLAAAIAQLWGIAVQPVDIVVLGRSSDG
jgi:hypothetical protein